MKYDKLVRDGIPAKIKNGGKNPKFHLADEKEFAERLTDKLNEEVDEFVKDRSLEELTDILEVVYALSELSGAPKEKLEALRKDKLKRVGGFKDRIVLDEIE